MSGQAVPRYLPLVLPDDAREQLTSQVGRRAADAAMSWLVQLPCARRSALEAELKQARADLEGVPEMAAAFAEQLEQQRDLVAARAREVDRLELQVVILRDQLRATERSAPPRCRASVRSGVDPEMGEPCGEPIDPYCPRHRDQPDTRHKPGCRGHCGHTQPGWWPACWTDTDLRTGAPQRT